MTSPPPILFLDFDGVLNSVAWTQTRPPKPAGLRCQPLRSFDPACIARLNRVTTATGAQIVVSSSWRGNGTSPLSTPAALDGFLHCLGVDARVIGLTPDLTTSQDGILVARTRGDEIRGWLACRKAFSKPGYKPPPFLAVDDDALDIDDGHTVRTDFHVGLTDADAEQAIEKLRAQGVTVTQGRL